uniref:Uncharacterized protein n=1 Tax=Anopheles quadriannulatus TaxID=34691 RepID=A0A182XSI9_ANOQN
ATPPPTRWPGEHPSPTHPTNQPRFIVEKCNPTGWMYTFCPNRRLFQLRTCATLLFVLCLNLMCSLHFLTFCERP